MKKRLLTFGLVLLGINAQSQVVVNVLEPSNISGNYEMTYTDPNSGWGSPDMLDPANALTDTLILVDDGTAADSLGCNAPINNVSGKIALIYRGTCEFGTKALMAQNAGAVAVIIINNIAGSPVGMGAGGDGASVTIPVFMITQLSGSFIRAELDAGTTVVAFLGNKNGLFDTDMGFVKPRTLIPSPNTNHSLLAANGTEFAPRIGAWIYNYGILDQTGGTFTADIQFGGSSVYNQSMPNINLLSGDSLYIEFPTFAPSSYTAGKYTLTYTLTTTVTDEYAGDNSMVVDFFISDDVFSYVKLDDQGLPISTTGYRTSTATSTFTSCVHFKDANASRAKVEGLYFAATTNTNSQLLGQEIILTAYQWDNSFTDLNDPNAAIDLVQELANTSYVYVEDSMDFKTVYAAFATPIYLVDNQRYLFCASTFDQNTYLGYGDLDYSLVIDEILQPMFPIQTDAGFNLMGFGGESSAIGVKMSDNNIGIDEQAAPTNLSVYPNPSKGKFHIKGDLLKFNTVELRDQLGRVVQSWKISADGMSLDVSNVALGNYLMVFNGSNGTEIRQVQISE